MELTTEASTHRDRLRRALDVFEQIDPPTGVDVQLDAGVGNVPASVNLFPATHADHEAIFRRLSLHNFRREPQWAWSKVQVYGVEVVLHDVRGAAA